MKEIYFAGGCFWGTQHFLRQINGVVATEVGYANGNTENPVYEQVYTDSTGFAEAVRVEYDPTVIDLASLAELYFRSIDPASLNRQGGDVGTRYRTGIYYVSPEDYEPLKAVYDKVAVACNAPVVVELEALKNFYRAEDYHQDYLLKNVDGYCHIPQYLIELARKSNRGELAL